MSCSSPAARRKEEETRELESQAKTKRIEEADEVRREDGEASPKEDKTPSLIQLSWKNTVYPNVYFGPG